MASVEVDFSRYSLIAGEEARGGTQTFQGVNPRTKTPLTPTFFEATPDEARGAVDAGAVAFAETRMYSAVRLAEFLEVGADEIDALGDGLVAICDAETALGRPRLPTEHARTANQFRTFARLLREGSYVEAIIDRALPERQPAPRPDIRRMLIPMGPVAVFTPNNFPLAFGIAGGDTASAFAAGCPVIAKGHPSHPATSAMIAGALTRAVRRAGFPPGFFSFIQGVDHTVGAALVTHPALRAVAFTGSERGGRALFDLAAARPHPIPVYAEMGSVNPAVILPGALRESSEALAQKLVASATLGAGQYCTNPGLNLLIDSPEARAFIALYARLMSERAPGVLLNAGTLDALARSVAETMGKPSVSVLAGGHAPEAEGYCYANTVLVASAANFIADRQLGREHFGPVTLFVICDSSDELLGALDALGGNLTAALHAADGEWETPLARDILDRLRALAGRVLFNDVPTGVEVIQAMTHGGPYPATTAPGSTSVGMTAITRFLRPVTYQNFPDALLPDALKRANPLGLWRIIDGERTRAPG